MALLAEAHGGRKVGRVIRSARVVRTVDEEDRAELVRIHSRGIRYSADRKRSAPAGGQRCVDVHDVLIVAGCANHERGAAVGAGSAAGQ